MRRYALSLALALTLLVPAAGTARAGDDHLRDDGTVRFRFYTDWELLYVERDRTPDVEVSFLNRPGDIDFREVLSTDAVVDDDEEFGGRGVLGVRLDAKSSVELVFMGWGHSQSATERSIVNEDLNSFENPDLDAGATGLSDESFDDAAVHDLEYDSELYSAELNYRRGLAVDGADYRFDLLAGLRVIRLEEDLGLTSWDDFPLDTTGFPISGGGFGTYDIATRNTLIGAQLGVETFIPLWADRVEGRLLALAGGYANQAQSRIDYFSFNGGPAAPPFIRPDTARQSRTEWDPAGVFEVAAHLKVRVVRGIRMTFGYRALFLVNIAAAPDQFARSGSVGDFFGNNFDNDGNTVFHGPSVGVAVDF